MALSLARYLFVASVALSIAGCADNPVEPSRTRDAAVPVDAFLCTPGDCPEGLTCVRGVCIDTIADVDGDGIATASDCDDADPLVGAAVERACRSACAPGVERCVLGVWEPCNAPSDCSCEPGQTRDVSCGSCGREAQLCGADSVWASDGTCMGQGECSTGSFESGASCGRCGTQRRTCLDTCTWDAWACAGEGECGPSDVETATEGSCGTCGDERRRTRACNATCAFDAWGAWGACETTGGCAPSTTENDSSACGACGSGSQTRARSCDATCSWGSWGAWGTCSGEAGCAPATVEPAMQSCGTCGSGSQTRTRTCTAACGWGTWGAWGVCTGATGCAPSSTEMQMQACATCGSGSQSRTRTCSGSCAWGAWGSWGTCACSGAPTWQDHVVGSVDNASLTSVTTSTSITGAPDDLYLAIVSIKRGVRTVDAVTGLGLTWNRLRVQCSGRSTATLAAFWAQGPAPMTSAVTAQLNGGVAFTGSALISVHRYRGASTTMPIGAVSWANTNGANASATCTGGTDSASYGWSSLDTTAASSVVFVGVHTASYTSHTPGAGYTERSDDQTGTGADSAGVAVEDKLIAAVTSNVTVNGSFGSHSPDWIVIAIEIRD